MVLKATTMILAHAEQHAYAVGGFNCYNLEWAQAIIGAAEETRSPVLLQILPGSMQMSGLPLVALCLQIAREASVPVNFHLDHHRDEDDIQRGLDFGVTSVMADGSHFEYAENKAFTRKITEIAHGKGAAVEAELGLLSGTEDGYTVEAYQSSLTDPAQAVEFVEETGVDSLAVCVGNVHGPYPDDPQLDFDRLAAIHQKVRVPLVMHGASGLPLEQVSHSVELGIRKFNVNTEVRNAYMQGLHDHLTAGTTLPKNALSLHQDVIDAMKAVVIEKMQLFGSVGKSWL